MVVARHDPIQHRLVGLARRCGVIEDLVEHDAQLDVVQTADHRAELGNPRGTISTLNGGCVRALRSKEVPRIVTPVEGVVCGCRRDTFLLLRAIRRKRRQVAVRLTLPGGILFDRGDIERREQMNRVQSGIGQLLQMPSAVSVLCKGEVGTP